jgi:hypothetical protein
MPKPGIYSPDRMCGDGLSICMDKAMDRWEALVRYDTEIREAAAKLLPFG